LISKDHSIRRLSFNGGNLDLVSDENGTFNLTRAFRLNDEDSTTQTATGARGLELELQKISIKGLDVSYTNIEDGRRFSSHIDQLSSSFKSDTSLMTVSLVSDLSLDMTTRYDTTFLRNKKLHLDITADYQPHNRLLEISKGSITMQ